jgi:hypothetical protein
VTFVPLARIAVNACVARGVEEGELPCFVLVLDFNLVCTDVLGDSTRFTSCNASLSDCIEKARLAMVDVAHDGDHGRTTNQMFEIRLFDHFDGLLRSLFHIVLKDRNIKFLWPPLRWWAYPGFASPWR